ncbi:calpain-A isoform X4 [Nasonia vitripennis]|uniref:Calpain-A n=1 Tax=Nasonia vitripennis TaxID=7425 RepID=A0A7M7QTD1_NASVI|nr:calpain-A isoform X4 [Nasonia vitripennis]XP_032453762.1 calpain-A isoform X4 [Nasonia vitripennis]XP_032453764.1 calpain-A isoform X4 [Nasonia vitripennis]XP_032453765.1 calpain-A isoform X4 [Nasonia vitripennis]XP_032453766.1 calpain-A isoform X4 [Nasonia vitripennis]XP_032453767.1 calpain-A isoform X4 [Nasonia vitripennis]XP_032453768.1 calpain-A isoform X4 [Nasonia vitripennis]
MEPFSCPDSYDPAEHEGYDRATQPGLDIFVKRAVQVKRILPSLFNIKVLGERGSGIRPTGTVQDFNQLRQECLSQGKLFEDPEFPAIDSSIFYSKRPDRYIEWRRPMEIADNPQLFVEGYSRFDVQQGELGDCWLLAAVANLTLHPNLFFQIVPEDQSFEENYAGIFHFRFWQYGRWVDVVIDDRLPTYQGRLLYLRSAEDNEFWSALLEKAYAKLHGSYEALKGGTTCEAMEDFTGGVTEMYEMDETPPNLFSILLKAYERNSLMGCSVEPDPSILEAETPQGLIRGHAYSITRVKYVDIQTPNQMGRIPLLRLRNPWGNEAEWNGPWSDGSPEWRFIPDHEKEELGLTFDVDGEFWMSFQDFKKYFTRLEICNLNPDSLTEDDLNAGKKKWEMSVFEGEWVRGVTAGGCRNFLETFCHNPQYRITLEYPDEDDDKCTVIIALMQKNRRAQRRMGADCLTIGFAVYHLENPDRLPKPLDINFFKYNASVARSPSFINLREVSCRFKLPPGVYCIVPSTFDPNEEGEFLLRIFSENKNNMEENDDQVGIGEVDDRVKNPNDNNTGNGDNKVQPEPVDRNEDKVKEFFRKLAGDDMEVDWMELKEILDYAMRKELPPARRSEAHNPEPPQEDGSFIDTLISLLCGIICNNEQANKTDIEMNNQGFSKDVCRSMVAMLDTDHSGKLGFEEFKALWNDIRNWRAVFRLYDRDGSGYLSAFELRQALNSAGYRLNNHILNILVHRYGTKEGLISFDDYIMCAVRLKTMIDIFRERDPDHTNSATFTLEEWVEKTLYS